MVGEKYLHKSHVVQSCFCFATRGNYMNRRKKAIIIPFIFLWLVGCGVSISDFEHYQEKTEQEFEELRKHIASNQETVKGVEEELSGSIKDNSENSQENIQLMDDVLTELSEQFKSHANSFEEKLSEAQKLLDDLLSSSVMDLEQEVKEYQDNLSIQLADNEAKMSDLPEDILLKMELKLNTFQEEFNRIEKIYEDLELCGSKLDKLQDLVDELPLKIPTCK